MRRKIPLLALALFGLSLSVKAGWQLPEAESRRELKVEGAGSALVTATTTVFLDDRSSGFILMDAQDKPRPFALLNRLGSRVSIHFEALPGESFSLYPLATTALPPPVVAHSSGLLHQTRTYNGSEVKTIEEFNQLWERATPQGGAFEENVYSAGNPFGPNTNTLHRYDGMLRVTKPGVTTFCVASTDASFLLINDRLVASWPGFHPVADGLDGSKRGLLDLQQPGGYRFTYLHANSGANSFAIAAMVAPGEKQHFVIGPEFFSAAAYAFVGPLIGRDGAPQADFIWENRYMVTIRDHRLYDMLFEAPAFKEDPAATYEWEFGDNTRASGAKVEHLVFADGDFPVTLTVTSKGRKSICRQTIRVAPRYGQSEDDDNRALALLERAVRQELERGIQPEGYALISHGYFFFLREAQAAAFAPRALAAVDRIPAADLNPMMIELALGVQQVDEQYELAESCFRVILDLVKEPQARAFAALHCGGMLNLCLNRPEDARQLLSSINRADLDGGGQRLLDIYLADTALILDNFATAQKLYLAIPKPFALIADGKLDRAVMFDYNSRYFRLQNLLSQELYRESLAELDMIEWDIPEERASPRMNLLKVQALVGNHQPHKAVVCIQRALLAEADETYNPKLRLELAKLYLDMNRLAQAKHQITLIRKESPWTQEELDARNLLKVLEEKLAEGQGKF
ncbi:MAG: PKD domain-containing protein [Kiritimatiellae bacterium]|nr:PKD domain-containing protein [Kiritimatiellia bacterium]